MSTLKSRRPLLRRAAAGTALAVLAVSLAACSRQGLENTVQNTINRTNSPSGLTVVRDLSYGPDPRNKLDLYAPPQARNAPVVLFIHGGSWQGGDKNGYGFVGESLARAGYVTGVMSYRLAPEHRYPDFVQDGAAALKYLRDHATQYGGDPDDLFVSGHSAGGFNAVELVDNARWLSEVNVPISAVRGVIGLAGPYSYDFRTDQTRVAFPEGSTPDQVMPDRHVRPDAPPHLLLVAANDTTVRPENGLRMQAALKKAGIPVELTVIPKLNHITLVGSLARNLTFLGPTRADVIAFIEAKRKK